MCVHSCCRACHPVACTPSHSTLYSQLPTAGQQKCKFFQKCEQPPVLTKLISRSDNCPEFTKLAGRKRKVLECPAPEEFTEHMNELSEDSIMKEIFACN